MRSWVAALERTRRRERLIASVVATSAVIALLVAAIPSSAGAAAFSATIRRTEGGIPHISAPNYVGLGYGYGYAFAQDNLCVMADDYVTVDAERSRFFGPNGSYPQRGNGVTANNLDSDFFFQQIIDSHVIDELLAKAPPLGPEQEVRNARRRLRLRCEHEAVDRLCCAAFAAGLQALFDQLAVAGFVCHRALPVGRPSSVCWTQTTGTCSCRAFSTRLPTLATVVSRSWAPSTTPFWTSTTRSAVFGRFSSVVIVSPDSRGLLCPPTIDLTTDHEPERTWKPLRQSRWPSRRGRARPRTPA